MVVKAIYGMMAVRFNNGLLRNITCITLELNAKVRRAAGIFTYLGVDVSDIYVTMRLAHGQGSLRQGRQPTVRAVGLGVPYEAPPSCLDQALEHQKRIAAFV